MNLDLTLWPLGLCKPSEANADPLRGLFAATIDGKVTIVEYEPDSDLRDTEQVPLLEDGGIEAFIRREVLPYTPDAWIKGDATKIGYEVSSPGTFTGRGCCPCSKKSAPIFWPLRKRLRGSWTVC